MILAIVIIAVTFLVVVGVMLAYWPKGISINENDEIQLSTYIGKPQRKICFTYNGELYVVDDWRQ